MLLLFLLFFYNSDWAVAQSQAQAMTLSQATEKPQIQPQFNIHKSPWTPKIIEMGLMDWLNHRFSGSQAEVKQRLVKVIGFVKREYGLTCRKSKANLFYKFKSHSEETYHIRAGFDIVTQKARLDFIRMAEYNVDQSSKEIIRMQYGVYNNAVAGKENSVIIQDLRDRKIYEAQDFQNSVGRDHLSQLLLKTKMNSQPAPKGEALKHELNLLLLLADYSRACCANNECARLAQVPSSEQPAVQGIDP